VVTVDGSGGLDGGHASGHELKDSHLSSGILASNTVRAELEVGGTTLDVLTVGVVKVRVQDLLGVGERALQTSTNDVEVLGHLLVVNVVALLVDGHLDLLVKRVIVDGSEGPSSVDLEIVMLVDVICAFSSDSWLSLGKTASGRFLRCKIMVAAYKTELRSLERKESC
jgi:hypothetical protein